MASVVASYANEVFANPVTISITAPSSGNTMILLMRFYSDDGPVVSVTDNGIGSPEWTQDFSAPFPGGNTARIYRRSNITNAPTSVSITMTSGALIAYVLYEVEGLDNSSPFEDAQYVTGTGSAPSVAFTSSSDNALGVGYLSSPGASATAPSGWTQVTAFANYHYGYSRNDLGTAGSKTLSPTLGSSTDYGIVGAAYRATGSPPPPPPLIIRSQRIVGAW